MAALIRGGYTVKPHVQAFFNALEDELGIKLSIGTYAGHSPPEGPTQAADVFNTDDTAGYEQQDRICAFIRRNAKKFGVRYCIRRHFIWNIERDDEGWRDQGVTGNRTVDHYDHVHVTFYASGGVGWNSPIVVVPPVIAPVPTLKERDNMLFGVTTGEQKGQVWWWNDKGRIFTYVGNGSAQRALEKSGVPYAGDYDGEMWEWFRSLANNASFTG